LKSDAVTSKQTILNAIRAHHVPQAALPALEHSWIGYEDPLRQFQAMVEAVGGRCVLLESMDQVRAHLMSQETFTTASKVISVVEGIDSSVDIRSIVDPHELEVVDWAVLPGLLGVAENGAVWVTDEAVRHRALYFIVQHLALVLPAHRIVHNLHDAYARLSIGTSSLGVFISGPSKTADIEQSLVIGAHGPRSLTVFCVADWKGVPSISLPA
jgi:L-lactate dehydrogenase complex protein LldG